MSCKSLRVWLFYSFVLVHFLLLLGTLQMKEVGTRFWSFRTIPWRGCIWWWSMCCFTTYWKGKRAHPRQEEEVKLRTNSLSWWLMCSYSNSINSFNRSLPLGPELCLNAPLRNVIKMAVKDEFIFWKEYPNWKLSFRDLYFQGREQRVDLNYCT